MKFLRANWFISMLIAAILVIIISELLLNHYRKKNIQKVNTGKIMVPVIDSVRNPDERAMLQYGRDLIANTAKYLGPHGTISPITNGLNCQNCHLDAGTRLYANNFLAVASTFPKFRARSGKIESIEFRINECLERSLNGKKIDSASREMRSMVAYLTWLGKDLHKSDTSKGAGSVELPFLKRAAEPSKGQLVFTTRCQSCHGINGAGVLSADSVNYLYPPVWGPDSYAESAGMFRISKLASYVRNNMPPGATHLKPQIIDEEAWDVAAYINSQPHPQKMFAYDWPVNSTKPVDYPFGPYSDGYNEVQHKYGPFQPIKKSKER
ncbi:MAG: c-type cytochrome [Ginsengibacter sp.]